MHLRDPNRRDPLAASSPHRFGHLLRLSAEASAPCAAPSTAARTSSRFEVLSPLQGSRAKAETDIMRRLQGRRSVIGFGHPVLHNGDPRNKGDQGSRPGASREPAGTRRLFDIAERIEQVMWREKKIVRPIWTVLCGLLSHDGACPRRCSPDLRRLRAPRAGRRTSSSSESTVKIIRPGAFIPARGRRWCPSRTPVI